MQLIEYVILYRLRDSQAAHNPLVNQQTKRNHRSDLSGRAETL